MYSHYLPDDSWMVLEEEGRHKPEIQETASRQDQVSSSAIFQEMSSGLSQFLEGIGKHFSLKNLDTGDILLVLILLFLFLEGDNLELVITLGLMLLLGLGDGEDRE